MDAWTASENQVTPMDVDSLSHRSTLESKEKKDPRSNDETKTFDLSAHPPDENIILARHKFFEEVLTNKRNDRITITSIAYCFFGIVLGILCTVLLTSWPQHHIIGNHAYWYEGLVLCMTGQCALAAAILVYTCFLIIGVETWNLFKTWFMVFVLGIVGMAITASSQYIFWVFILGYVWPIPFNGYGIISVGWWNIIINFWFQCPKSWRRDLKIRKKILWGILFVNMSYAAEITYKLLLTAFQMVDRNFQWPFVIVVVVVRELNGLLMSYFGRKINGYQDMFTDTLAKHLAAIRHILFLSISLGSVATETTSYLILGSDFVINLLHCFQILWYNNTGGEGNEKKKVNALLSLVINEATEFVLPISYGIIVTMAYYGPNAELIGNIKNGLWHYTAIERFDNSMFWITTLFLADLASTVVSFILLKVFCKINIVTMFLRIQKHVGFLFAIQQAYFISEVSIIGYYK